MAGKTCGWRRWQCRQPGRGEVVLRVGAALTCGTDLKVYRRGYHAAMLIPPCTFGHEVAGTVVDAGAGAAFAAGERVVALNSAPCGVCYFCRKQQPNLCSDLLFNNGAYAEFLRVPARIVEEEYAAVAGQYGAGACSAGQSRWPAW